MAKFVRDIMTKNLVTLDAGDSIASARKLMMERGIHSVLIPPLRGGRLWRIFSETDLLLSLDAGTDPMNVLIGDYASPVTITAKPEWTIEKAREQMIQSGVKHLPVIDNNGNVVGMVSSTDVIRAY